MVYNLCNELFNLDINNIDTSLKNYFNNDIIEQLYFLPKKIDKNLIDEKLNDKNYISKVLNTISYYKDKDIEIVIKDKINQFVKDTTYNVNNYKLYVIIGLDTTTIYSIKYMGEDVTVLLLESTNGIEDNLNLLLAHEFTHWVRKQIYNRDIFEDCIGERFIVEGIGCNYSREIVPNREEYEYCIVNKDTFEWVKNNIDKVELYMKDKISSNELMRDYFYMFADTEKMGMPVRVGYVYGYLKVKEYLDENNLKIKDILNMNWEDILFYK